MSANDESPTDPRLGVDSGAYAHGCDHDSSGAIVSLSFGVPVEIWEGILSFATLDTIKAFSLSSKAYRGLALPVLFSRLKLCRESLQSFREGNLSGLESKVRHITLQNLAGPFYPRRIGVALDEVFEAYGLLQTYTDSLHIFHRLRSLEIPFDGPPDDDFQSVFLSGLLQRISDNPQCIKILNINYKYEEITAGNNMGTERGGSSRLIKLEKAQSKVINPPTNIEDLTVTVHHDADFSDGSDFWNYNHSAILWSSSQVLRKLSLTLGGLECSSNSHLDWLTDLAVVKIRFPVLEDVSLVLNNVLDNWDLEVFVQMFPNIQYFNFDAIYLKYTNRTVGPSILWNPRRILYHELAPLKRLRKARIVWPLIRQPESGRYQAAEVAHVEASVGALVEQGSKDLECVEVIKRSEETVRVWLDKNTQRHDGDLVVFRVFKTGDEVELRQEEYLTDWWRPYPDIIRSVENPKNDEEEQEAYKKVEELRDQISAAGWLINIYARSDSETDGCVDS